MMMNEVPLGFASAFILGLSHSLEPSHAKVVLASYFLNQKRTLMEAVIFAVTVTLAHTLVIYLLAFLGYTIGPFFQSKIIGYGSELIGGVIMICIGVWMFYSEQKAGFHKHCGCEDHHSHGHFFHHHEYHHDHPVPSSWYQVFLLGFCSGAVPCMSGLAVLVLAWSTTSLIHGLTLVAVFSSGLGLVVLVMCIIMQQTAHVMDVYWQKSERWTRFLPVVSSAIITLTGLFVLLQGILRF